MDAATKALLDAVADHVLDRKAKADAASSKVVKKTEQDNQIAELEAKNERNRKLIKLLLSALIFSGFGGAGLWGYVKSYGDERVIEAEKAKEVAEALHSAAEHIEAQHVDPQTVHTLEEDVGLISTQVDALVEYNLQSHEYMLNVLAAGKRKPPKPPELKRAESALTDVGQAKTDAIAARLAEDVKAAKARKAAE